MSQDFFRGEPQTIKNAYFLPGTDARSRKITGARSAAAGWARTLPWLGLFIALVSISVAAWGQVDITGRLVGTVTDATGAVVQGAQVVALNPATGTKVQTNSNDAGYYELGSVPAGAYVVTVSRQGFESTVITTVVVHAGDSVTLPVHLQVGATTTTVTVSGTLAVVDAETANIQTTFDTDLIPAVPVEGRDPRESLELLMPGAVAAGTGLSYNVPVTSFNGVSGVSNNYSIDGIQRIDQSARCLGRTRRGGAGGDGAEEWNQPIPRTVLDLFPKQRLEREQLVQQPAGRATATLFTTLAWR
jgi:Carboxypeptidase regulatory-like domain